jgi:hypothetical protein
MDNSKLGYTNNEQTADNLLPVMLAVSGLYSLFKNMVPKVVLSALAGAIGAHPVIAGTLAVNHMASQALTPVVADRTYSMGTTNAEELLKLSSLNNELFNFMCRKYAFNKNNFKKVANTLPSKLYSLGGKILKCASDRYSGFSPSISDLWRKAVVTIPIVMVSNNLSKTAKVNMNENIANHPLSAILPMVAFGSTASKPLSDGLNKLGNFDNYGPDTVKLLFDDGEWLDTFTMMKLGELF